MTRLPRLDIPGVPQHVVQRGNNRLPCFLDDDDRQRYLRCLRAALLRFGCHLHAYVLMSNHVHLLLTPDAADALVLQLRHYLQQQKALGTDQFQSWVEARTGRFSAVRSSGRPPRR